jgi:hypothetical protein
MNTDIDTELENLADEIGGDKAAVLRKMASEVRAAKADEALTPRQVRILANGTKPLTMLQAISAAAGDPDRIRGLQNLHARARRLGFDIPPDGVITREALDSAIDGRGTVTDRIALKNDLLRNGMIAAY